MLHNRSTDIYQKAKSWMSYESSSKFDTKRLTAQYLSKWLRSFYVHETWCCADMKWTIDKFRQSTWNESSLPEWLKFFVDQHNTNTYDTKFVCSVDYKILKIEDTMWSKAKLNYVVNVLGHRCKNFTLIRNSVFKWHKNSCD